MTTSHSDAAKWDSFGWSSKITHAHASTKGAVGVLFIWTDPGPPFEMAQASFIVKPLGGSALSTTFAEKVLQNVADTDSPDSIELNPASSGYTGVKTLVRKMVKANTMTAQRAAPYLSAGAFVLQKMMSGYSEMSDVYKASSEGLRGILTNATLMTNLGKLGAADLILGNGDRIENGNFTNIMFNADGTVAAIDSASILASFKQLTDASDAPSMDHFGQKFMHQDEAERRQEWVAGMARGGGAAAPTNLQIAKFQEKQFNPEGVVAPVIPPMARMSAVEQGSHGVLFEQMKEELMGRIEHPDEDAAPIDPPTAQEWLDAKENFVRGFTAGLASIDTLLGGKAWLKRTMVHTMKSKEWRDLKKDYKRPGWSGEDPNMSWLSLVVRREMYRALRRGSTMAEAIVAGEAIAARKQAKAKEKGKTWRMG